MCEETGSLEPLCTDVLDGLRHLNKALLSIGLEPPFIAMRADPMYFLRYDLAPESAVPSNFAVLGDAMIKLNPVFGQGCSKAMVDVASLDEALRTLSPSAGIPRGFSKKLFKLQLNRGAPMFNLTRWQGETRFQYIYSRLTN